MKKDTHPQYFANATIVCNCKNVVYAGSTKEEQTVEVCSACHPFFTGKTKLIDTAGRVNRFKERMEKAAKAKAEQQSKAKASQTEEAPKAEEEAAA